MRRLMIPGNCAPARLSTLLEALLDSLSPNRAALAAWEVVKCGKVQWVQQWHKESISAAVR